MVREVSFILFSWFVHWIMLCRVDRNWVENIEGSGSDILVYFLFNFFSLCWEWSFMHDFRSVGKTIALLLDNFDDFGLWIFVISRGLCFAIWVILATNLEKAYSHVVKLNMWPSLVILLDVLFVFSSFPEMCLFLLHMGSIIPLSVVKFVLVCSHSCLIFTDVCPFFSSDVDRCLSVLYDYLKGILFDFLLLWHASVKVIILLLCLHLFWFIILKFYHSPHLSSSVFWDFPALSTRCTSRRVCWIGYMVINHINVICSSSHDHWDCHVTGKWFGF